MYVSCCVRTNTYCVPEGHLRVYRSGLIDRTTNRAPPRVKNSNKPGSRLSLSVLCVLPHQRKPQNDPATVIVVEEEEEGTTMADMNLKSPAPHAAKPGPFAFPFSSIAIAASCAFDKTKKPSLPPAPAGAASTAAAAGEMVPPPPAAGAVPSALQMQEGDETKDEWAEGSAAGRAGVEAMELGAGVGVGCGGDVRTAVRAALAVGA